MCAEMDSLDDENGGHNEPIKASEAFDSSDGKTRFFDSQGWSPEFLGGGMEVGDGDELLQSTMLLDDTQMVEDAFETQVVDLAGETQAMDFGGETQVMNICCETQVLDDGNCFDEVGTQLLDEFVSDSDGEGSNNTEVLGDEDDLSDDDLVRKCGCQSVDKEQGRCFPLCEDGEKLIEQPNASSNQLNNAALPVQTAINVPQSSVIPKSGSGPMRLTSVRAASLRASGLAARNRAFNGTKNVSSSIPTGNLSSDNVVSAMEPGKEGDQERDTGRYNGIANSSRDENMCKGSILPARNLFPEDLDSEKKEIPDDTSIDGGEDLIKLMASDLAGLSYFDSQEPGELSQANALDFVDRFIKESFAEFDKELVCGSTGGKSKCVSSIKGTQKLAKKANEKSIVGELDIYEWDDSREDEGGGDIFSRRKEDFFCAGSLGRRPSKPRVNGLRELKDSEKQSNGNDKGMDKFNPDKKLLHNRKADISNEPRSKFRRNLINELDKQSDIEFQDKQLEKNATKEDVPEMLDVGFDTQMAAEAMETLFSGMDTANCGVSDTCQGVKKSSSFQKGPKQQPSRKRACFSDIGCALGHSMKTRRIGAISSNVSSVSSEKQSKNVRKQREVAFVPPKPRNFEEMSHGNIKERKAGSVDKSIATLSGGCSLSKQHVQEKVGSLEPVVHRTRRSARSKVPGIRASTRLATRDAQLKTTEIVKPKLDEGFEKMKAFTNRTKSDASIVPRRRRSSRNLSCQVKQSDKRDEQSQLSVLPGDGQTSTRHKRSCKETRTSTCVQPVVSSVDSDLEGKLSQQILDSVFSAKASCVQTSTRLDESWREKSKPSDSSCTTTPLNSKITVNKESPVCMGNEYFNQTRRRSLSNFLLREIQFSTVGPQPISPSKDLRKRREITDVRVLYSNHLDEDVIKRQKKILARLGISMASSILDATHFIADQFVRTRNVLEAIASGKPVVTHSWIESCGQANCFIDEKSHILRDAKKEKEFGFSMPASLACASQNPLLQGFKVFITQNTKPGKQTISSLVKTSHGQAIERIGRSLLKDGALQDDLLILSCEEDYEICVPFIEKGATIYSSELLLNGIVTQRLEYERYRLFTDHLRITRSTIRFKKHGSNFLAVTKRKRD